MPISPHWPASPDRCADAGAPASGAAQRRRYVAGAPLLVSVDDWVRRADAAMYSAKTGGRDRVEVAS